LYVESEARPEIDSAAFGASRLIFTDEVPNPKGAPQPEEDGKSLEIGPRRDKGSAGRQFAGASKV
jgi:hypothetical protein